MVDLTEFRPRLETKGLVKRFRGRTVVDNVDLWIEAGEIVGLLGPNGAGKTTTFHIVIGLILPDGGSVLLNGENISDVPMYLRARRGISYLPQEPSAFRKLTVEENLYVVAEALGFSTREADERVNTLLEELGIATLRANPAYTLSGGERRRVEIARALVIRPSFILLDEPFAGIDPIAVLDLQKTILRLRERRIGVLITDHNVRETLRITDRAYIIKDGAVFRSGAPEVLSNDVEVRKVYLGEHFRLH
ncbi:MAG TPA: LPS export ABC transporter ATP-binding protein [Acidobacteriota bacterium]|nr:LPS export ABC transporter ATP-binding protein [Acidobacteriota bacterium]HRR25067.1 LPS export ABC transporter ATP-binding protein [Acidobacteriota bacterium]HRV07110.1 LPS export ABC transporter ATP-binding protein [Acidobacteriota bacterium]